MCHIQHTKRIHLTQEKRVVIEALVGQGSTIRAIANIIEVHYSTVSRELSRNRESNGLNTNGGRPHFLPHFSFFKDTIFDSSFLFPYFNREFFVISIFHCFIIDSVFFSYFSIR